MHELVELNSEGVFNVCARDSVSKYEFGETGGVSGLRLGVDPTNPSFAIAPGNRKATEFEFKRQKLRSKLNFNGITINDAILP